MARVGKVMGMQMDVREQCNIGFKAYKEGDFEKAFQYARPAAEQGIKEAQCLLGYLYRYGKGVPQDLAESMKWYRAGAEQGDSGSQYSLARGYEKGLGVEQDLAEAARWYRLSANQGDTGAQVSLGLMYLHATGVDRDYDEALRLFHLSAEQGNGMAMCNIGYMYEFGYGVEKSWVESARWYRKSVENGGGAVAHYNLGLMYEHGRGMERDIVEAAKHYRLAAEQGDEDAQRKLAAIQQEADETARRREAIEGAKQDASETKPEGAPEDGQGSSEGEVEAALGELNSLIGLQGVKDYARRYVNRARVNEERRERGMRVAETTNHCVFVGNPGTGKTTVARILARIFKGLGVVSAGQLVETDYSGLVAEYVGQTAQKTRDMIDRAMGGVLFIDEAYALADKNRGGFGQEAIDTLLKAMEDRRGDFVVIAAGYADLMESFIRSNPGLESRFQNFIAFDDYNSAELLAIFESMCEKNGYTASEGARASLTALFDRMVADKDDTFANAREARKVYDLATEAQATRLCEDIGDLDSAGEEALAMITAADIDNIREV